MRNSTTHLGRAKANLTDENTGLVIANAFLMITSIELLGWRIGWTWNAWNSVEDFENEKQPITDFQLNHWLDGQDFIDFQTSNSALLAEIDSRFRGLCLPVPSENAVFQSARFDTINYSLNVDFADGGKYPICRLSNGEYHTVIAENMDVIAFDAQFNPKLIPILHAISATKNVDYFADSQLILPS